MQLPVRKRREDAVERRQAGETSWWQDPFEEFERMWNHMGSLFEQAVQGRRNWVPMVEVEEERDAYLIRAELPGIKKEDVNIDIDERRISITGQTSEEERGDVLRRRSGQFSYFASLPFDVNTDQAEATLREGILTVRLPRSEGRGKRRIELKA